MMGAETGRPVYRIQVNLNKSGSAFKASQTQQISTKQITMIIRIIWVFVVQVGVDSNC